MKKIIFTIFLGGLIYGCDNSVDTSSYKKHLNEVPEKFTSHFLKPERISGRYFTKISHTSEYKPSKFVLTLKMAQSEFDSIKTMLDSAHYQRYSSNDSIPLIVNRPATPDNWIDMSDRRHEVSTQKYKGEKPPIINFYDHKEYDSNSSTNLPDDYLVYVIEAEKGVHWDDKHHEENWFMPEEWKDGFSRGIALNDNSNIVIFWVVVW